MKVFANIKKWIVTNPKKFYFYAMILLVVSFVANTIFDIYAYKTENRKPQFIVPSLYRGTDAVASEYENRLKEMETIAQELAEFKSKHKQGTAFTPADSLRIEYLYEQYQTLKNGKNKEN